MGLMTYIPQEARRWLDPLLDAFIEDGPVTRGELNYCISRLVLGFLSRDPLPPNYATLSAVRAVLFDAADEFYRRAMVPYEDLKAAENGDLLWPSV